MIHLYTGDGKGKTTAAMGLALRMLGHDKRVVCAQFLKGKKSGEIQALERFERFQYVPHPTEVKFVFQMTDAEKADCAKDCARMLRDAAVLSSGADMLILDEVCAALTLGMLKESDVLQLIAEREKDTEIVLTGRDAPQALMERADYISELRAIRHPYDKGASAREGVEF